MIIRHDAQGLCVQTPAKVNLHLEVLAKRADGFHELETLFMAVSLYDTLVFRAQPSGTKLRCRHPEVGEGEENLVQRAVRLVRDQSGCSKGVSIELIKQIPVAAGLAGGSSDAAATLAGLNHCWQLGWPQERLVELAARLGSDVPFFLFASAAIGRGRGERLSACPVGATLHMVLVSPSKGLATAEVFRHVQVPESPVSVTPMAAALETGNVAQVAARLHNRLQEVSRKLSPAVAQLERQAQDWDCLGHLMSGSGSSYFALCSSPEQASALGLSLQSQGWDAVFVVQSIR